MLDIDLYLGKRLYLSHPDGVAYGVVHHLTRFLERPHHIFTDSFYTSEKVIVSMAAKDIHMTGTINKQTSGVPKVLCEKKSSDAGPVFTKKIHPG